MLTIRQPNRYTYLYLIKALLEYTNPYGILLTANIKRKDFALSCTFQKVCFRKKNIAQLVSDEKSIKKQFTYRLHTKDVCIFIVFILGQSLLILQFVEP